MKYNRILTLLAVLACAAAVPSAFAQTAQQLPGMQEAQQGPFPGDPIRQLNLTPEQREQIRSIRENSKAERAAINSHLRDANLALEEALNVENPDDALVEQRVRDVANAQAAAMRMRIQTEIRIRRVLTAEQREILRSLQRQAREAQRDRLLNNPSEGQRRREERRILQNQRNGLAPLFPRRQNQRRPPL
ncbi:MAG TPA: Spy/CpxP family protein refolding chaperone [Pyrinomonadaceae bacterium]|jgi:Spy/CpxP family protein refolding chaperone|nr:Spy/CpxP family protein refolding chaperone [Pyrinomonadaceae bacterium]